MSKDRQHGCHGIEPIERRLLEQQQVPDELSVPREQRRGLPRKQDVRRERGEHRLQQQQRRDHQEPDGLAPVGLENGRSLRPLVSSLLSGVLGRGAGGAQTYAEKKGDGGERHLRR